MNRLKAFFLILISTSSLLSADVRSSYIEGDSKRLLEIIDSLEAKKSAVSDTLLYYAAEVSANAEKSVGLFNRIINQYPQSAFYNLSLYRLAGYGIVNDDTARAVPLLKKIILSKDDRIAPAAYSTLISVYERGGNMEQSSKLAADFVAEYPNSEYIKLFSGADNAHATHIESFFTVQIGSFSQKENAEKLFSQMNKKKYDVFIDYKDGMYKVRIGRYKTKDEAVRFQQIFQKSEGIASWVIANEK